MVEEKKKIISENNYKYYGMHLDEIDKKILVAQNELDKIKKKII